jgi:putative flippase GtrA
MTRASYYGWARAKLLDGWRRRALSLKAIAYGLIGVVNTGVDYSVFLLARSALSRWPSALAAFSSIADTCHCGKPATILLVAANMTSWIVAVTGSYIMNSSITFAAESGRKLRWRDYVTFVVSGVAGLLVNTATLVAAAEIFLFPIWLAKGIAILASFAVNFSLSHFVVFRVRAGPADEAPGDV